MMRRALDELRRRQWEIAALIAYEAGKNRLEAVGEVEEVADFFSYYATRWRSTKATRTRWASPASTRSRSVCSGPSACGR